MKVFDSTTIVSIKINKEEILADYKIAHISRQLSLLGRREVLTGNFFILYLTR
jgi:glutamine cyclotransferase